MRFSWSIHLLLCLSLETLTFIIGTGSLILVELMDLGNSVIIFLSQMTLLRWLTFLLRFLTVTVTVLLFWICFFLLTLVFVLQWLSSIKKFWSFYCLSFHWLSINSKRDAPFHHIAYDYSRADWDGHHDHLRDGQWEDIFKLSVSAAASEFCEWVQVRIDVCIPHRKYQISFNCMVFSSSCCCHSS